MNGVIRTIVDTLFLSFFSELVVKQRLDPIGNLVSEGIVLRDLFSPLLFFLKKNNFSLLFQCYIILFRSDLIDLNSLSFSNIYLFDFQFSYLNAIFPAICTYFLYPSGCNITLKDALISSYYLLVKKLK